MIREWLIGFLAGGVLVLSCQPAKHPDPRPDPCGGAGSGPIPSACYAAGNRLAELECRTADGAPLWTTPNGAPFGEACEDAAEDGRDWHPQCIATIHSCDELESAYRGELCR